MDYIGNQSCLKGFDNQMKNRVSIEVYSSDYLCTREAFKNVFNCQVTFCCRLPKYIQGIREQNGFYSLGSDRKRISEQYGILQINLLYLKVSLY